MKVLIACESSAAVRDAFAARGHHAVSCDLLPTEVPGPHYMGNVFDILHRGWDLLIAHPPCTFLAVSANKWLKDQPARESGKLVGAARRAARRAAREEAIEFFMALYNSGIPRIAIENPIGCMSTVFRRPDQVIQPWHFGHPEKKGTCLWLKGLPRLRWTNNVYAEMMALPKSERERMHYMSPGADRWKERSRTYSGIADAFADQWGNIEALKRYDSKQAKQTALF